MTNSTNDSSTTTASAEPPAPPRVTSWGSTARSPCSKTAIPTPPKHRNSTKPKHNGPPNQREGHICMRCENASITSQQRKPPPFRGKHCSLPVQDQSDQDSSPYSRPPQSRERTSSVRPRSRTLQQAPEAESWTQKSNPRAFPSISVRPFCGPALRIHPAHLRSASTPSPCPAGSQRNHSSAPPNAW